MSESGFDLNKNCNVAIRGERYEYYDSRFNQLNSLIVNVSDGVWQYLLAVNGGGAAAMLGFIGAVSEFRATAWPYVALAMFTTGLVLVGLARADMVHRVNNALNSWNSNMARYLSDEITWPNLLEIDRLIVNKNRRLPWVFGWISFALFVVGVFWSAYSMSMSVVVGK